MFKRVSLQSIFSHPFARVLFYPFEIYFHGNKDPDLASRLSMGRIQGQLMSFAIGNRNSNFQKC
jgi:hypothetical protein